MERWMIYAFSDEASPLMEKQTVALKRNHLCGPELRQVGEKNISDLSLAEARQLKGFLDREGLTVWSLGSPMGKWNPAKEPFSRHMERFRRTLDLAAELGAKAIRIFSFYVPDGVTPEAFRDEAFEKVSLFVSAAKDYPIRLCHENEKKIYGDTAERCAELIQTFPMLRSVFDPANFVQCGVDTLQAFELLRQKVEYLHIKDAMPDGSVVPAGEGAGHVKEIVREYLKDGGHIFTIEPHLKVFKGLSELEHGGDTALRVKHVYPDSDTAFDTACRTFETMLKEIGEETR